MEKPRKYSANTAEGETPHDRGYDEKPSFMERPLANLAGAARENLSSTIKAAKIEFAKIDRDTLGDVYTHLMGKAGLDVNNIPDFSKFPVRFINSSKGSAGSYTGNEIILNAANVSSPNGEVDADKLLQLYSHEVLHYLSTSPAITSRPNRYTTIDETRSGVSLLNKVESKGYSFLLFGYQQFPREYAFLNEGLTEIVNAVVLREYNKRKGTQNEHIHLSREFFKGSAYIENQEAVHSLAIFYSVWLEVPLDTILQSFVRAYFRNGPLALQEFVHELTPDEQQVMKEARFTKFENPVFDWNDDKSSPLARLKEDLSLVLTTISKEKAAQFEKEIEKLADDIDAIYGIELGKADNDSEALEAFLKESERGDR